MNIVSAIAIWLLAAAPAVQVHTLDGQTVDGGLLEVSSLQVAVETAAGRRDVPLRQILEIEPAAAPAAPAKEPSVWVELIDGSTLAAANFSTRGGAVTVTLLDGSAVQLARNDLAAVRLQAGDEPLLQEWRRVRGLESAGDLLVTRKENSIDYHRGVLGDTSATTVEFELDGEQIPVKREKVFGLAYFHASNRELPATKGVLIDDAGGRFALSEATLRGDRLAWTTPAGARFERPWSGVAKLDFSAGKIVYLSELQPEAVRWTPAFGTAESSSASAALFAPRMNAALGGGPLTLDGKKYAKGIALHSRTEMTFRLGDRYTRLTGWAGIDDRVRPNGNLRLVIRGDDRVLYEATIAGDAAAQPIDVEIGGQRRLTFLADFGAELDLGDNLILGDLKVVK